MARIMRAEQELEEMQIEGEKLLKEINFLRFQNLGIVVLCGVAWVKKARDQIIYKRRKEQ